MNSLRFVPTIVHAIVDYVVGVAFIAAPLVLALSSHAAWVMIGLGSFATIYSLLTDYELGVARVVSVPVHLVIDAAFGLVVLMLPWLIDVPGAISAVGLAGLILSATTKLHAGR